MRDSPTALAILTDRRILLRDRLDLTFMQSVERISSSSFLLYNILCKAYGSIKYQFY